jgi:hypothetical protein
LKALTKKQRFNNIALLLCAITCIFTPKSNMLKKVDYYGQLTFTILIVLSSIAAAIFKGYTFVYPMIVLFFLGIWQLISALVYTFKVPKNTPAYRLLSKYWILCIGAIFMLIFSFYMRDFNGNQVAIGLFMATLVYSLGIAVYYLYTYKKYILTDV